MKRNRKILFIALLAGVFAFGTAACSDDSSAGTCGDDTCDPGEDCTTCEADCGQCDPCNHDGVCDDAEGENAQNCCDDCCTQCDLPSMTGTDNDFLVDELYLPTSAQFASENGVDIDGDGDIDNRLGSIISLLASQGVGGDINGSINDDIAAGNLLLATRVKESGQGDGIVAVQIFQAEIFDSTPIFDGDDTVLIPTSSPQNLFLCGEWDGGPDLETSPANVTIAFPLPEIGLLEVTLSAAQIRTVTDPDNPYYDDSSVDANGMTNVMIGGGLSKDEIYGPGGLIEFLATFIQGMVDEGGSTADTIAQLFDGACTVFDDVPGCEDVVEGEGECDDTADPPVITATELKCNSLLHSALAPDVDINGDGENDLVSLGLRIASAVPVTLEFEPL
jgi:hypothetical protein